MIAGKTHSEILAMKQWTRERWYRKISPEEEVAARKMMENVRRTKLTGQILSPKTRAKMKESWTPERKTEQAERMTGENNPMKRPEVRDKVSKTLAGHTTSEETRAKIGTANAEHWKDSEFGDMMSANHSKAMIEYWKDNAEAKAEKRASMTELWKDPEYRDRQRERMTGENNPMKRPEVRTKISAENSPHWRGGISFEPYGMEFNRELKSQIRERDNFTCQECHQTEEQLGRILDVHHIDYDKKNNNPDNLISLCRSCHSQTNFGREDWTEYFGKIMEEGGGG